MERDLTPAQRAAAARLREAGVPPGVALDAAAGRMDPVDVWKWNQEYQAALRAERGKWGWGGPAPDDKPRKPPMMCLSLWQPWASLLVAGRKRCETRGWRLHHRGPLLIHAAKKMDADIRAICMTGPFREALAELGLSVASLPLGAVVGRVDVVDCRPTEDMRIEVDAREKAFGDYSPGRFAFLCSNAVRFGKPVPYPGRQSLFDVPAELIPTEEPTHA